MEITVTIKDKDFTAAVTFTGDTALKIAQVFPSAMTAILPQLAPPPTPANRDNSAEV